MFFDTQFRKYTNFEHPIYLGMRDFEAPVLESWCSYLIMMKLSIRLRSTVSFAFLLTFGLRGMSWLRFWFFLNQRRFSLDLQLWTWLRLRRLVPWQSFWRFHHWRHCWCHFCYSAFGFFDLGLDLVNYELSVMLLLPKFFNPLDEVVSLV